MWHETKGSCHKFAFFIQTECISNILYPPTTHSIRKSYRTFIWKWFSVRWFLRKFSIEQTNVTDDFVWKMRHWVYCSISFSQWLLFIFISRVSKWGTLKSAGNPRWAAHAEIHSICTDRPRPGPAAGVGVSPTSDTGQSVAILMNRRHWLEPLVFVLLCFIKSTLPRKSLQKFQKGLVAIPNRAKSSWNACRQLAPGNKPWVAHTIPEASRTACGNVPNAVNEQALWSEPEWKQTTEVRIVIFWPKRSLPPHPFFEMHCAKEKKTAHLLDAP